MKSALFTLVTPAPPPASGATTGPVQGLSSQKICATAGGFTHALVHSADAWSSLFQPSVTRGSLRLALGASRR